MNFSAGPSILPEEVLKKCAAEILNYEGTGESVMEMSHRSSEFKKICEEAEMNLRTLMNIPEDYYVLFLQGGGTLQFSMIPINLMTESGKADYVVSGEWGKKAYQEALKFGDVRKLASSEDKLFSYIPKFNKEDIREDVDYVYVCYNNTIYGTHYNEFPDVGDHLLVADMSSCILSEEIDVSKFGLIFAGAQKNIAPAGLTIVIVRKDLVGKASEKTPVYLDYGVHAKKDSMYNTPPCWSIYVAGEVFKHLINTGGINAVYEKNLRKANKLYDCIDSSKLFRGTARKEDRSIMNITFVTGDPDLDKKFVSEAKEKGMLNLAGHRSIGGIRASLYNALPEEYVDALINFMKKFESENV
ncbi:MAG TPA: 3-phosphoserine/phosphohydroxythreonine transaminase [Mogibacterium sp.]|nr:3-phosphoserine/phosphohydroxythreonine transaminase [Mogibacterium sp.]